MHFSTMEKCVDESSESRTNHCKEQDYERSETVSPRSARIKKYRKRKKSKEMDTGKTTRVNIIVRDENGTERECVSSDEDINTLRDMLENSIPRIWRKPRVNWDSSPFVFSIKKISTICEDHEGVTSGDDYVTSRSISIRDVLASRKRYCGSELADLLDQVCRGRGFNSRTQYTGWINSSAERGVVAACCRRHCSLAVLERYCAGPGTPTSAPRQVDTKLMRLFTEEEPTRSTVKVSNVSLRSPHSVALLRSPTRGLPRVILHQRGDFQYSRFFNRRPEVYIRIRNVKTYFFVRGLTSPVFGRFS